MQPDLPTPLDRLMSSIRRIIRAETRQTRFFGVYEYAVQRVSGSSISASPTDTTIGLPALDNVPVQSVCGIAPVPVSGTLVLVIFVNGDPSKYACISVGSNPTTTAISEGAQGVARLGDTVGGMFAITTASLKVTCG